MRSIALFLFFLSSFAYASDIKWQNHQNGMVFYDSALAACSALIAGQSQYFSPYLRSHENTDLRECRAKYQYSSDSPVQDQHLANVWIVSGTCPDGAQLTLEGTCPNRCESTQGQTTTHEHKRSDAVGAPPSDPPSTVCSNSCQYVFDYNVVNIYVYTSGNPSGVFGAYTYRGNGQECNGDTLKSPGSDSGATTNPDETPPPTDGDKCPEGYIWNGTFCSKADDPPKPCYPDAPPGSLGACDDGKDPEEPGDGDDKPGDGDDNPGDGDGSGDGSGDGDGDGSGDGDGDGKGDGDGDGKGQCDPAKDPNCKKEEEKCVSGAACSETLQCKGDVIQCAMLQKQKEQSCMYQLGPNEQAAIEKEFSGDDNKLGTREIGVSNLFNEAVNKGRWLPARCPSPERVSVMGTTVTVEWTAICRFAEALGPILVILASIFFAVYIGKAVRGS